METPSEEFEHIPWAQLGAEHQQSRNRLMYLAAAALVAVAVGAVTARSVFSPSTAAPAPVDQVPTDPAGDEVLPPPVTEVAPATSLPAPLTSPALYSEADLLAGLPDDNANAAAARAEWFVSDYFTADLDPLGSLPVRAALPAGSMPSLPHDGQAAGVTYVEWARAYRVDLLDAGLYRVEVVFRAVGATGDDPFFRFPVRSVAVVVAVGADGGDMAVVDLPSPVRLPLETLYAPWPDGDGTAPDSIAAAALDTAGDWGAEPAIVSSTAAGGGWRVVVSVADDVGNRWPLSLWLDEAGLLAEPPWPPG